MYDNIVREVFIQLINVESHTPSARGTADMQTELMYDNMAREEFIQSILVKYIRHQLMWNLSDI